MRKRTRPNKKAPSVAGGACQRLRHKTQRTTSFTAQPNWVMVMSRAMHTELFMSGAIPQRLCAIKFVRAQMSAGSCVAPQKRRANDCFGVKRVDLVRGPDVSSGPHKPTFSQRDARLTGANLNPR
jgi:hypothetical protein